MPCCAFGCNNRENKNEAITFHRFPADENRRRMWISRVNRLDDEGNMWQPSAHHKLCSVSKLESLRFCEDLNYHSVVIEVLLPNYLCTHYLLTGSFRG